MDVPIFWHIYIRQICLAMMSYFSKNTKLLSVVHCYCCVIFRTGEATRSAGCVALFKQLNNLDKFENGLMAVFCAMAWFRSGVYAIDTGQRRCAKHLNRHVNEHSLRDHDFS